MEFLDFSSRQRSRSLGTVFPSWKRGESVAFFAPHDDDVPLGAGYLLRAAIRRGGRPVVVIFCRGDAGFSTADAGRTIVAARKREAVQAYGKLGVPEEKLIFLGVPDFTLMSTVSRGRGSKPELFDRLVAFLRRERISRIVTTSPHFENWDHTAAFYHAVYTSSQAGDPVLADLGPPSSVRTILAYSVWSDFGPGPGEASPAADKGILASKEDERTVREALRAFRSQAVIMERTAAVDRRRRRMDDGYLELYRTVEVRRPVDYAKYAALLKTFRRNKD